MKFSLFVLLIALLSLRVAGECRYRNLDLPSSIFSYWASWGCYIYTRPDFFNKQPIQPVSCSLYVKDVMYFVPGIQQGIFCQPFHHSNEYIVDQVGYSFWHNRSVTKWIECSKEAEDCCAEVMAEERVIADRCPSVWDGWSCFRSIPTGQNYRMLCSRFAYGYEPPRCNHYSYKTCYANASWNEQTDYSQCDVTPPLLARNRYYIAILSISTIFCLPALLVLFLTKVAQSQKLLIIRALLLAVCIHNTLVILVRILIIIPELTTAKPSTTLMYRNTVGCRSLTFFEKFAGNLVFCCMLLIGIFLHQFLTNLFRIHDRSNGTLMIPYYVGVLAVGIGSIVGWTVIMHLHYDHNCWQVTDDGYVDWILDGPRLVMLCVNLLLLLHITVRLWRAFNAKESDESPFFRTLKAALTCLPVFGMQFLFLLIHPDIENCGTEQFYYIINYTIAGAQGIFIAIFHCYTERDVSKYFVDAWRRLDGGFRRNSNFVRRSAVTETRHTLFEGFPTSQRAPITHRPRSNSLPDYPSASRDTQI